MKVLGNIIWFVFGGWLNWIVWTLAGILCCITIVGIPFGQQCFKFANLTVMPFGKDVEFGGGAFSMIINIIWIILIGWEMAVANVMSAVLCCISIIGIPFAGQFIKIAKLWLMPFGAEIKGIED
ncbi:MAG: YccF domain-containing protein [Eubacterium sp.]|nr:YccF domain-containing protein [Eubacterium sp.]